MKENEGFVDEKRQQLILYVEKEDGQYGPMQTGSYITKNFLEDYEYKRINLEAGLRKQVVNGEISPLKYYMVLEDLTEKELASRAGLCKRLVKKHLTPKGFSTIRLRQLKKYGDVFNIPPANLLQFVMIHENEKAHSVFVHDVSACNIGIQQDKTSNPLLVVTNIGERKK